MDDLKAAMRSGDRKKVEVLRMIKTSLQMAAIDAKGGLSESDEIKILAKEAKKRKDAAAMYKDAGDHQRAEAEDYESVIISEYLPEQLSDEKITEIIDEIIAEKGKDNLGTVIGATMAKVGGKAEGGRVSALVRERISK